MAKIKWSKEPEEWYCSYGRCYNCNTEFMCSKAHYCPGCGEKIEEEEVSSYNIKEVPTIIEAEREESENKEGIIYYKKYINALRKCAKEHENDRTSTGHIIVSDLCREDTANLLEALEQEAKTKVFDEIRTEIEELDGKYVIGDFATYGENSPKYIQLWKVLQIINKYKEGISE